jgi:hypothetical protein
MSVAPPSGSRFVVERAPDLYAESHNVHVQKRKQAIYEKQQQESVNLSVLEIRAAKGEDLQALFYRVLSFLAERRQAMARHAQTENWHLFGLRRDSCSDGSGLTTPLDTDAYKMYLPAAMKLAIRCLNNTIRKTPCRKQLQTPSHAERGLSTTLVAYTHVHPHNDQEREQLSSEAISWHNEHLGLPPGTFRECLNSADTIIPDNPQHPADRPSHILNVSLLLHNGPLVTIPLSSFVIPIFSSFATRWHTNGHLPQRITPQIGKDLLFYLQDVQIRGLTCDTHSKGTQFTYSRSAQRSMICHQPAAHHAYTLLKITQIFQRVIKWQRGGDLAVLQRDVGDLVYLLHHAAVFCRGSAAVCEHMEMTLYSFHGYNCTYTQDRWVCLEALTSTLEEFREKYPRLVALK